jgi:uncharacterized protein
MAAAAPARRGRGERWRIGPPDRRARVYGAASQITFHVMARSRGSAMADHPNATLFREGYAAFGRGDMATLGRLLAPDVVWHSPGKNTLSGDYTGIPAVLALFGRTFEVTGGTFRTEVHDIVANEVHGVALVTVSAARDGKPMTTQQAHVVHFRDGKLAESWLFAADQAAIDELFR